MTRGDMFSPHYYSKTYTPYERFIDQMKSISDGFEKWRYSYESSVLQYESSFVLSLIEAVKSVSNKIQYQKIKAKD